MPPKFKPNPHRKPDEIPPFLHKPPRPPGTRTADPSKFIEQAATPERIQEILFCIQARVHGYDADQIAQLSAHVLPAPIPRAKVLNNLDTYTRAILQKPLEEYREVELQRLDYYLQKLSARINNGDDKAINTALRISEHRAKLQGTFAPQKINVTQEISPPPEIMALIEEAKQRASRPDYQLSRVSIDNVIEADIQEEAEQPQQDTAEPYIEQM